MLVSNPLVSSVVPFKHQINSFGWTKFFKDFSGIKYRIDRTQLSFEEVSDTEFSALKLFFTKLEIPFTLASDPNALIFNKELIFPVITEQIFFEILKQYYFFNTSETLQPYCNLINNIIADVCTQIRIVSESDHALRMLIENLKRNIAFSENESLFSTLIKDDNWDFLKDPTKNPNSSFRSLSIHTWLHILRHPSKAKENLIDFLGKLYTRSGSFYYASTLIPVIDPKGSFIYSLTFLSSNPDAEIDVLNYWLTLGSLVLRNINYALLKFSNLSLEGLTQEDIAFYEYLKPKMTLFTESCYNTDLVDAFKKYENPKSKIGSTSIRGHELYTYNRSTILEYHLKQAQNEFNRFPNKKILRKRVNRRSSKLYSFLDDVILAYYPYLNEIANLTKASGNYNSVEKIIENGKFLD